MYDLIRDDKIEIIEVLGNELNITSKEFDFNNNNGYFADEDELGTRKQINLSENETFIDKEDNNYNSGLSMEIKNKNINEFNINNYNF